MHGNDHMIHNNNCMMHKNNDHSTWYINIITW